MKISIEDIVNEASSIHKDVIGDYYLYLNDGRSYKYMQRDNKIEEFDPLSQVSVSWFEESERAKQVFDRIGITREMTLITVIFPDTVQTYTVDAYLDLFPKLDFKYQIKFNVVDNFEAVYKILMFKFLSYIEITGRTIVIDKSIHNENEIILRIT